MQEDEDNKKDLYKAMDEEDNSNQSDEQEEDSAEGSMGQSSSGLNFGGKGGVFKGISKFASKAGKTVKKIAKIIAMLPLPAKIALATVIAGIIAYIVIDGVKKESTKQISTAVNKTITSMENKLENGELTDDQKETTQKAINYFKENNSYLYFTIQDINDAYQNYVNEFKGTTNDVGNKTYASLSKTYGSDAIDEDKKNSRVVDSNDSQSLYQHLLMTEKYNFNGVDWYWYGHGHDGEKLSYTNNGLTNDKELGLKYPSDGSTDLEVFIKLVSPYMQTWHIPLAFHSAFLARGGSSEATSKFTYSVIKNAYSDIMANRYDVQSYLLNTKFNDYIESVYKSKIEVNIKVTLEYRAQTVNDTPSRRVSELSKTEEHYVGKSIELKSGTNNYANTQVADMTAYETDTTAYPNAIKIYQDIESYVGDLNKNYVDDYMVHYSDIFKPKSGTYLKWAGSADNTLRSVTEGGTYYSVEYTYEQVANGIYTIKMYRHELLLVVFPRKAFKKDSNGDVIYDKYYKYEYTGTSVLDSEKIAEYYVNERAKDDDKVKQDILGKNLTKDPIPEIDPKKEVEESHKITVVPQYYIKSAKTFDTKFANEYNYIKYKEEDVENRVNAKYEKEILREDYYNLIDEDNKITTGKLAQYVNNTTTLSQLISEKGLEVVSNNFKNKFSAAYEILKDVKPNTFVKSGTTTNVPTVAQGSVGNSGSLFYETATLTGTEFDNNPYNVSTFADKRTLELTYKNIYRNSKTYIEQIGVVDGENQRGTHHIERFWKDELTQVYAKEELYTTDDLIDFNASYNKKLNSTTKSEEKEKYQKLIDSSSSSYQKYETLEKNEKLNNIDFINSNSNIFNEYLVDVKAESKITGYDRSWIEFALEELKSLFEETEKDKGGIPYKYGSTLGLTSLLKPDNTRNVNSSSGVFAWPVPDKQKVSYLYGYSGAYGIDNFHNGVDISIQSAEVIAAADGTVVGIVNDIENGTYIANSYGNYIKLEHTIGSEKFYTLYAHMAKGSSFKVGDTVKKGDVIGISDTTGSSTGYHLHFSMFKDLNGDGTIDIQTESIDPLTYYNVVPDTSVDPNLPQYSEIVANAELAKTLVTKQDSYLVVSSKSGSGSSSDMVSMVHSWEHATEPTVVEDGGVQYYIIEDDGAGHPTVGYGIDIFNGGYATLFEQNGYPTDYGGKVPKDFVDQLEEQELEQNREDVLSRTEGLNLTDYQIDALISRAYNCGPSGAFSARGPENLTFIEAYKKYWKDSDTSTTVNYNHLLYVNFMQYPYTSGGQVYKGLIKRRKAEWMLFQTGAYTGNDGSITAD